jgi:itaconate CoA-transferase
MGMAMTEPPALLKALADRAAAGKVDDLKIYYFESTRIAGETILRYELGPTAFTPIACSSPRSSAP